MKRIIVAGGRDFSDLHMLFDCLDAYLSARVEIVTGGCKGADQLAVDYATVNELPQKVFPADWDKHGKAAGPIRNKQMAEYADGLIAFWDGKSKGTKNMMDQAKAQGLRVVWFQYWPAGE